MNAGKRCFEVIGLGSMKRNFILLVLLSTITIMPVFAAPQIAGLYLPQDGDSSIYASFEFDDGMVFIVDSIFGMTVSAEYTIRGSRIVIIDPGGNNLVLNIINNNTLEGATWPVQGLIYNKSK
jgi:hypothetical protein